jgi:hypothetical protein
MFVVQPKRVAVPWVVKQLEVSDYDRDHFFIDVKT